MMGDVKILDNRDWNPLYGFNWFDGANTVYWNHESNELCNNKQDKNVPEAYTSFKWNKTHALANLVHELSHVRDHLYGSYENDRYSSFQRMKYGEISAVINENFARRVLNTVPGCGKIFPRPVYLSGWEDLGSTAASAWLKYNKWSVQF